MRPLVKGILVRLLASPPGLLALKARARGRRVILGYHNVIEDDEPLTGDRSIHLRRTEFRQQLDLLARHCHVVALEEILAGEGEAEPDRLRVAVTFDDAYAGTLRVAVPELVRRGMPVTVFVPTGMLGGRTFWWDSLGITGWEGGREPLEVLQGRDERIRSWARERGLAERNQAPGQRTATLADLAAAAALPGVRFAAHTVGHPNLTALADDEIRSELEGSRAWLRDQGLPLSNLAAYPYGLADHRVAEVARGAGFDGGMRISGGWLPREGADRFLLPRIVVPAGLGARLFLVRVFGVFSG